jgi:hypothetical protein
MQFLRRHSQWVLPVASAVALAGMVAPAASAGGPSNTQSVMPPGNVYTCDWISEHVAAGLRAGVTCDAITFFTEMTGFNVGPQPADTSTAVVASGNCLYHITSVPTDGSRVGNGVFAWGPGEYSNCWTWKANYAMDPGGWYNWWVEKSSDNSVLISGQVWDTTWQGPIQVQTYAVRKWGAQNKGGTAQSWDSWWGCSC